MKKERMNEIWGVLFLLLGLFLLAGLVFFHREDLPFYTSHPSLPIRNYTGLIGAYLSFGLYLTFGAAALLIPLLFLLWSGCFFLQRVPERKAFKFVGLTIALFSASTLVTVSLPPELRFDYGGAVGYLAGTYLLRYFGRVGSYILAGSCLLLSLLLATDFLIYPLVKALFGRLEKNSRKFFGRISELREAALERNWIQPARPKTAGPANGSEKGGARASAFPNTPPRVKKYQPDVDLAEEREKRQEAAEKAKRQTAPPEKAREDREAAKLRRSRAEDKEPAETKKEGEEGPSKFEGVVGSRIMAEGDYSFPSVDLLRRPVAGAVCEEDLQEKSRILEQTLSDFGIDVKIMEVEQGPVITRYELMPAPGVKVNSIAALSDDLALALKAPTVRLIIPIPGKSAIGVEVPNAKTTLVYLRELVESAAFRNKKFELPLALGKDTSGRPVVTDLTSMPHLLIAGTTGSGKTVCVNSLIAGLLYARSPSDLKFVMIDPKMVELAIYKQIPHMLTPVVTDIRKAYHALNWVVNEMENRYKLFATVGVRNIQAFNERPLSEESRKVIEDVESENVVPARLPYIVVVIDELADLMLVAQEKVETAITRLAQLSRAVGIHLILATQRPSVDVITGVIKANFPARISFKVASKVDSRTVLDGIGADKLIGRGDMLFLQPGDAKPIRGQAALIIDEEISKVVDYVSKQANPEYRADIQAMQEGKGLVGVMEKDELFDEAVSIVLETGQASTSNLQRRMRLGYTRAARIIDQMEAEGIVGPAQGAKAREIYIDRESREEVE